jgi:hypothetical protein
MGEEVEPVNDLYLSLKMVFLTSAENLNHVEFQTDFIEGVIEDQAKFVTMPVVVDVANLVAGKYDKLTHKYKNGKFGTNQIGGFYKFETNQNGEVLELIAYARIWKRDDKVIASLEELYGSDDGLKFSYECLIGKYVSEGGTKKILKDPLNNPIGSAVVSFPAVLASKALLLAETYKENFIDNQIQGGDILERNKELTQEQFFANTKIHFISELDISQVQRKCFNKLKAELKETYWEYDSTDMGVDYIIMKNYSTADLLRVDFTVGEDDITITEMYAVDKTYTRKKSKEGQEMATIAELELKVKDLEIQVSAKDTIIAEKENLIKEKETALATVNITIAQKEADIVKLGETIATKDAEISTLTPFKVTVEKAELEKVKAEKATKRTELTTKCAKILSKEELETAEMKKAIEDLDENYVNKVLAEKYVANATKLDGKKPILASRITDNIELSGSEPNSLKAKYSL